MQALGIIVYDSGFRLYCLLFRVQCLGLRAL